MSIRSFFINSRVQLLAERSGANRLQCGFGEEDELRRKGTDLILKSTAEMEEMVLED